MNEVHASSPPSPRAGAPVGRYARDDRLARLWRHSAARGGNEWWWRLRRLCGDVGTTPAVSQGTQDPRVSGSKNCIGRLSCRYFTTGALPLRRLRGCLDRAWPVSNVPQGMTPLVEADPSSLRRERRWCIRRLCPPGTCAATRQASPGQHTACAWSDEVHTDRSSSTCWNSDYRYPLDVTTQSTT